ncbi:MAG: hypothetical protein ACR2QF_01795, partial [Geminicoccaceae bacterium]
SFDREVLGINEFDDWEIEADRHYVLSKFLAISSGRGIGKTWYLARRIWHHQFCYFPALSFCSGPKINTVKDGLMPALAALHQRMPPFFQEMWTLGTDKIESTLFPMQSMVLLRTAAGHNPDGLKGPRLAHMLVVGDEYSGISDEIHKRLTGFLTTKYGRFIATSQPTMLEGPFHRMFHKRGLGYKTITVPSTLSRHVDHSFVKSVASEFGEDSDEYRIDVLGEFPLATSSTLIPMDLIKVSMARAAREQNVRPVWGYDHAEDGGDRCALAKRQGTAQLEIVQSWREPDPDKSCQRIADEYHDTPKDMRPRWINVDATVLGLDLVRKLKSKKVPCVRSILPGKRAADERYQNVRTHMAFLARQWMREDGVILDDPDLHDEIVKQTFMKTASQKHGLPDKMDDYERSPDLWDAWMLTFARDKMDFADDDV